MMKTLADRMLVTPERLRRRLDPADLPFETTAEVITVPATLGQRRALDALEFGLAVESFGYNIFVTGAPGSGRSSSVRAYLERLAADRPAPDDWVYVHNFAEPDRPVALRLPAGRGAELAREMAEFVRAAQRAIPQAFDSDDYARRRHEALADIRSRREAKLNELQHFAAERGFTLEMTPTGIVTVPILQGQPLSTDDFQKLAPDQRELIERRGEEVQTELAAVLRVVRQIDKEAAERIRQVDRAVALFVVGPLFEELREQSAELPEVLAFLDAVRDDLPDHLDDFRSGPATETELPSAVAQLAAGQRTDHLARYRVNVFIDNSRQSGAPVIEESNPTYYNLVGRVDYRPAFGTMVTDFHEIRPGVLHRAQGGFLILSALEVLRRPLAWDALKRALSAREIRIENLGEQFGALPTASLRPMPIPLDLKVVLIGPPAVYNLLYQGDEDFRGIFRVRADFAPDFPWTAENVAGYAGFISRQVRESNLRHFDRSAVARVVETGARLREHQGKLSSRLLEIADLVTEASFWAGQAKRPIVTAGDVDRANQARETRSNLVAERIHEMIAEGTILIETSGERVGQVNGLSVVNLGDHVFGQPSRVSARVALGRGTLQSIEREIELSGPIHSKGFLTLAGYLAGQYAQDYPLALSATITFEQSYGEVDGDSAASTELYALLSALAGLPLRQGIAVTGSVNQYGDVQAVGGVTHKIEGFFAVCQARGLTGDQGVLIPAANVQNLMLSEAVVAAVRAGQFHIWAVRTIDEGIELLTGRPAGPCEADGTYPAGSVHQLVDERLRRYAALVRPVFSEGPPVIATPPVATNGGHYD